MMNHGRLLAEVALGFLKRHKIHAGALAVFVILGLASAAFELNSDYAIPNASSNWALPTPLPLQMTSSVEKMLETPLFGGTPVFSRELETVEDDSLEAEEEIKWRLVGIISEGIARSALVEVEKDGKIEDVQLGGLLPGGEVLAEVYENSITVKKDNESQNLALFVDTGSAMTEAEE